MIHKWLKHFLRGIVEFYSLKKNNFFSTYNDRKSKPWRKKHKDVRNLFRLEKLKKKKNDTTIKDIRNIFRPSKKLNKLKLVYLDI